MRLTITDRPTRKPRPGTRERQDEEHAAVEIGDDDLTDEELDELDDEEDLDEDDV
jgi:hypothetical protein